MYAAIVVLILFSPQQIQIGELLGFIIVLHEVSINR